MLSASNLGNTPKEMAEELILKHQVAFEDAKVKAIQEAQMYKEHCTSVVIVEWWEQVIEEIKKF